MCFFFICIYFIYNIYNYFGMALEQKYYPGRNLYFLGLFKLKSGGEFGLSGNSIGGDSSFISINISGVGFVFLRGSFFFSPSILMLLGVILLRIIGKFGSLGGIGLFVGGLPKFPLTGKVKNSGQGKGKGKFLNKFFFSLRAGIILFYVINISFFIANYINIFLGKFFGNNVLIFYYYKTIFK